MTEPLAKPGDRIGRYVIESALGTGGMGQVYRAYDEVLHRRVALKLLHTASLVRGDREGAEQAVERIRREARMAAALDHRNVVAIHDVGEQDGVAFIVMEHVLGRSLRSFVGADVPVDTRIAWLLDVARALAAAHRAGLVHRDIKPENVMVRNDGAVKVLDFGIARRAGDGRTSAPPAEKPRADSAQDLPEALRATLAGTREDAGLVGTPGYMSPELMSRGQSDSRSDQFAWGVLAYELLAGKLPWSRGSDASALCAGALFDPAPPLADRCPDAPPEFAAAVNRALAKEPTERFDSMAALLTSVGAEATTSGSVVPPMSATAGPDIALAPTAASGPGFDSARPPRAVSAGTLGTAPPAVTERRRPPATKGRVPRWALALLAIVPAVMAVRVLRRPRTAAAHRSAVSSRSDRFELTNVRRLTFDQGCEEFPSFTPDGQSLLFDAQDGEDYHLYLMSIATGERRRITSEHGWQYAGSLSPDGLHAAYLSRSGEQLGAEVVPIDGSSPPRPIAAGSMRPSWSPDGRSVWAGSGATVERYDLATGHSLQSVRAVPGHYILQAVALPDGEYALREAAEDSRGVASLWRFDPRSHHDPTLWLSAPIDEAMSLSPDQRYLYFALEAVNVHNEIWRVPLAGGEATAVSSVGSSPSKGMQFSPRGDRLAWSDCGERTGLVALETGGDGGTLTPRELGPNRDWRDWNVVQVPGTPLLAMVSDRSGRPQLWVVDPTAHQTPRMVSTDVDVADLAVSPDRRWIAYSVTGSGIFVTPFDGSGSSRRITHAPDDSSPTFSSDSSRVYFQRADEAHRPRLLAVDLVGGTPSEVVRAPSSMPSTAVAANLLAYVATGPDGVNGTPHIRDLDTGNDRQLSADLAPGTYQPLQFSPDARYVAITDAARQVIAVEVASGRVVGRFDTGGDQVRGVAYTERGIVIARTQWTGDLWIADVQLH